MLLLHRIPPSGVATLVVDLESALPALWRLHVANTLHHLCVLHLKKIILVIEFSQVFLTDARDVVDSIRSAECLLDLVIDSLALL